VTRPSGDSPSRVDENTRDTREAGQSRQLGRSVRRHRRIIRTCARWQPVKGHRRSAARIPGIVSSSSGWPSRRRCARRRDTTSFRADNAGWRLMEPSGCNRCQSVANLADLKTAQTSENLAVCDQLPRRAHGKEGIDGSSPSEGPQRACKSAWCRVRRGEASRSPIDDLAPTSWSAPPRRALRPGSPGVA
jgi:hypothetical protein